MPFITLDPLTVSEASVHEAAAVALADIRPTRLALVNDATPVRLAGDAVANDGVTAPTVKPPGPASEQAWSPVLTPVAAPVAPSAFQPQPVRVQGALASVVGHGVMIALLYVVGSAGLPDQVVQIPVDLEIVIVPASDAVPEIRPPRVEPERPEPTFDPVAEKPPGAAEPVVEEPQDIVAEGPAPEAKDSLPDEPAPPASSFVFEPPPPTERPESESPLPVRAREKTKLQERRERLPAQKVEQARQQAAKAARRMQPPSAVTTASAARLAARGTSAASISAYLATVASRVARNRPSSATAAQAQGLVIVVFSISASGGATDIRISRSSGESVLDHAAVAAVRRASPFPPPPSGAPRAYSVPMRFSTR